MATSGRIAIRVPTGGRCEDCDLRDALTLAGKPRVHARLGFKLTSGCESCGGSGRASRTIRLDRATLRILTPKQKFVIERRLGLVDGTVYSQGQIAEAMGRAQQTVSDLEIRARQRLLEFARNTVKKHSNRTIT